MRDRGLMQVIQVTADLSVPDLAVATSFWTDVLGFEPEDMGLDWVTRVVVRGSGEHVQLLTKDASGPEDPLLTLKVDDVDEAYAEAERHGCEIVHPLTTEPWGVRRFFVRAPGGVVLNIAQHHDVVSSDPDAGEILELVRTFFAAFTSGDGVDERLDALRAAMLPQAVVVRTGGRTPAVYDVESFIAPRREMLVDGTLVGFGEQAEHGRLEVFGDIAHWFGRYAKDGLLHGEPCPGAGTKSLQFVRTDDGWRISAAAWDDEREGLTGADHRVFRT